MNDKADSMKGKQVVNITVSSDQGDITFHHGDGDMTTFCARGDCCSNSWIEDFENVSQPEIIRSFNEVEISPSPDDIKPTKHDYYEEVVQYYFYRLITDKGVYNIEMRNSSNGYYGGWLE